MPSSLLRRLQSFAPLYEPLAGTFTHLSYGLDYFFNGTASRAERGLEVSLISIVDVSQNQALALSAEQTPPQPDKQRAEKTGTRIDFYLQHLQRDTSPQSWTHRMLGFLLPETVL